MLFYVPLVFLVVALCLAWTGLSSANGNLSLHD